MYPFVERTDCWFLRSNRVDKNKQKQTKTPKIMATLGGRPIFIFVNNYENVLSEFSTKADKIGLVTIENKDV